jgi:hypothetical protein
MRLVTDDPVPRKGTYDIPRRGDPFLKDELMRQRQEDRQVLIRQIKAGHVPQQNTLETGGTITERHPAETTVPSLRSPLRRRAVDEPVTVTASPNTRKERLRPREVIALHENARDQRSRIRKTTVKPGFGDRQQAKNMPRLPPSNEGREGVAYSNSINKRASEWEMGPISGRTRAQHRSIANSAIFTNRTASSETRTRNAGAFDAQASPSPRSGIVKLPDPLVPMTAEWRANIEETVTVTATPMTTYRNLEGRRHGTLLNERKAPGRLETWTTQRGEDVERERGHISDRTRARQPLSGPVAFLPRAEGRTGAANSDHITIKQERESPM